MPPDAPKWGFEYKKMLGSYFNRTMSTLSHSTSLPQATNTVTLDRDVKDSWDYRLRVSRSIRIRMMWPLCIGYASGNWRFSRRPVRKRSGDIRWTSPI